jgi:hypothetical protein
VLQLVVTAMLQSQEQISKERRLIFGFT